MTFAHSLLHWYDENRRTMPWRGERDPYKIWVSEIILQQTRVNQGWEYYLRFIEVFPHVKALAEASQEQVLKVWQGLGYYSRARNMHEAAKTILSQHQGIFPNQYEDIRALKGIGDYTAAAIASMAFDLSYPAVDGNLFRVICRMDGIYDDIQLSSTKKLITQKCDQLMKGCPAGDFNQAMMDFGALQCTPKSPKCETCPFQSNCYAFQNGTIDALPVKIKKIVMKERYLHYFFFTAQEKTILRQRTGKDIWQGLFEFPMIEASSETSNEVTLFLAQYQHSGKCHWQTKHQLTHQIIHALFYVVSLPKLPPLQQDEIVTDLKNIQSYPFPKIFVEFFK